MSTADDALQRLGALQAEYAGAVSARERLDGQRRENEAVQQEFATLKAHNTVYKLVGPVLVQQEHGEARLTVGKRLDIIRGDLARVDAQLKDLAAKMDAQKAEIAQLQAQRQAQAQAAA